MLDPIYSEEEHFCVVGGFLVRGISGIKTKKVELLIERQLTQNSQTYGLFEVIGRLIENDKFILSCR